jgi:hypothetical protein
MAAVHFQGLPSPMGPSARWAPQILSAEASDKEMRAVIFRFFLILTLRFCVEVLEETQRSIAGQF